MNGAKECPRAGETASAGENTQRPNYTSWSRVSKNEPCPACGKPDWCAFSPDGAILKCERSTDPPVGMKLLNSKDGGALFGIIENSRMPSSRKNGNERVLPNRTALATKPSTSPDWTQLTAKFTASLTTEKMGELAGQLGVTPAALNAIGCGWASADELRSLRANGAGWADHPPNGAYVFPERAGDGRIIGLSLRALDGRKGAPAGSRRGLIVPSTLKDRSDPVLIVEGATDVAACDSLGLAVVGRPSNSGGAEHLAHLCKKRIVLVVGENDAKDSGAWPGRDGAERVAVRLGTERDEPVSWTLPPAGIKDVRTWLQSRIKDGLNLQNAETCHAAGVELLSALQSGAEDAHIEKKAPQSELLARLAHELYRIGVAEGGEAFAVAYDGPNVALMLRGSKDAVRSSLAREYRRRYGTTPNASALTDALTALAGEAMECEPETVYLRMAEQNGMLVIDLGGPDGRAVIVKSSGWEVVDSSPVLFRRTALTGVLPEPECRGSLDELRGLLNVNDTNWPLVIGAQIAALIPNIPHPVTLLGGGQGTGKSTGARLILGVIDPSPAQLRSQPKDERDWAVTTAGSWAIAVDNVSSIPAWWSDALCRTVTGDGWVARKLYSDSDVSVLSFRRVIFITSIDTGALRGDLGDRLLLIDLERIEDTQRRTEAELMVEYEAARPRILGALLDLLVRVLERMPGVRLSSMPRMADFSRVLAAIDQVLGTSALDLYLSQRGRIAIDVIESDPVGIAIRDLIELNEWEGPAGQLLKRIKPENAGRDWPKSGRGMAGRLKRLVAPLRDTGIEVISPNESDKTRKYIIRKLAVSTARIAQLPEDASKICENDDSEWAIVDDEPPNHMPDRPMEFNDAVAKTACLGDSGDSGDRRPKQSSGDAIVPNGWTRSDWKSHLCGMADRCEEVNPQRAAELRSEAEALETIVSAVI